MKPKKSDLLVEEVEHIDIKEHNVVPLVEAMSKMAFSARDLGRAAQIYDQMIRDEDQLRVCDATTGEIADSLPPRPHSSREFIKAMGKHLIEHAKNKDSVVLAAYEKNVPIFCPAFS